MPQISTLSRFLDAASFRIRREHELHRGIAPFITLSRQSGIDDDAFCRDLLAAFARESGELFKGWQVFDGNLCALVAEDKRLRQSLDDMLSEHYKTETEDYVAQFVASSAPQRLVAHRLAEAIRKLAALGKAVFVGRGGMVAARGLSGGIHVRLVAPRERRVTWLMKATGVDRKACESMLAEQDASRARLLRLYYRSDIEDSRLYDVVFNVDNVPFPTIAALLVDLVGHRARRLERLRASNP